MICTDPSLSSFSLTTHRHSHIQRRRADLSHVSGAVLTIAFIFRADESATVMCWNKCFVHQLPPSTQIDGACNWWPLCVIAKINRHCCGHGRSMSCTKQARERAEFMGHHIHQQHTITISCDRFCCRHTLLYLTIFNTSFCVVLISAKANGIQHSQNYLMF